MRAVKRERSYLDPKQIDSADEEQLLSKIEAALADGMHIEAHRLDELLALWRLTGIDSDTKTQISYKIDGIRAEYLANQGVLSAVNLSEVQQKELSRSCADVVSEIAHVDIPQMLVDSYFQQAAVIFGIKEAYIYRDWQAAIGDFMLVESNSVQRRFSVMGYGDFEEHYLRSYQGDEATRERRWLNRLQALVYDLDMEKTGNFDARRQQLFKLYEACAELNTSLDKRIRKMI